MRRNTLRRLLLLATAIAAAVLVLLPFETTVAPESKLRVLDESGKPVAGVPIREVWSHNVLETEGGREVITSNPDGYVLFPRRAIKANFAKRAARKFVNVINPHGASGPTAYVFVLHPYEHVGSTPYYDRGRWTGLQIIVRPATEK